MTDTDWSFSLRSATRFCDASDSDGDDEKNYGDTGAPSRLSSSTSLLRQIDLAGREDSAQYKPNPWSIARINATTRTRQPNAPVSSVPKEPVAKKPPQGAIADAFMRQAQKSAKSPAQANPPQTSSQTPTSTCVAGAFHNLAAPASSPTTTAHIATFDVNPVSIPLQPTREQRQSTLLPSFLPRNDSPVFHPSKSTPWPKNPCFTPSLRRVLPFSSPGPGPLSSNPQRFNPGASRQPPALVPAPSHYMLEPQTTTPNNVHLVTDYLTPTASAYRQSKSFSQAQDPEPVKLERKAILPYPGQNTRLLPRPRSNRPIMKASLKPEKIPSSPSPAQARHFFEGGVPPVTAIKQPSPESAPPKEEPPTTSSPSRPRFISPLRKRTDAYGQLPPSPDSEWSTLKPPSRKANKKTKPKAPDVKSGKFRLPLSLETATLQPQKKARVVTYLPPPPPKKPRIVAGPHPRIQRSGLPSPPPSDETAPPSSPTPSVGFDSNDVSTRYRIVRAKIRQVRMSNELPYTLVTPFDPFPCGFVRSSIPVAEGARCSTLGRPRVGQLWCCLPRSRIHRRC